MMRFRFAFYIWMTLSLIILLPGNAQSLFYTVKSDVNLRSGPGTGTSIVLELDQNQSLQRVANERNWIKVATLSGKQGYVRSDMVSDLWIKVYKRERRLYLMKGPNAVKMYPVALSPSNPEGDKVREGDGGTPEGRFFICESIRNPRQPKYGARSMRLSYPDIEDARRGLKDNLIDYQTYVGIVQAVKTGQMPNQRTPLGSSIRIHGGGSKIDWTLGCIALNDDDIIDLFGRVPDKVRVEIYKSAEQDVQINSPDYLVTKILERTKSQVENPALYTEAAGGFMRMHYPMGDIMPDQAVCTDVVIRALRNAGLDLQALVHEDILLHPGRYSHFTTTPDHQIDHRRTRNLQIYFTHHAQALPEDVQLYRNEFKAGDIVTLDTIINNYTKYDHIGVLVKKLDPQGYPLVFNIWNTGLRTNLMDLLGNGYPQVVGHFRMTHFFDYQ